MYLGAPYGDHGVGGGAVQGEAGARRVDAVLHCENRGRGGRGV